MNQIAKGIFLMAALGLLVAQGAWAEPFRHESTGIVFPDHIATLEKAARVRNYEAESPGLGISVGYDGPGITATVYIYTLGMEAIPDDLESAIMKDHFQQVAADIERAGEMGLYSGVKKLSEGKTAWEATASSVKSLHASYRYAQRGDECRSHLDLLGFRHHFLKIRYTYDREVGPAAETIRANFLSEFSRILGGIGETAQPQGAVEGRK
jgi:hypothetical protein